MGVVGKCMQANNNRPFLAFYGNAGEVEVLPKSFQTFPFLNRFSRCIPASIDPL